MSPWWAGVSTGRLIWVIILPFAIYFGLATAGKALQTYRYQQQEHRLRQEVGEMEARYQALAELKGYLESDAYLERAAREELGLVKPGETEVVIIAPSPASSGERVPTPEGENPRPPWRQWWDFFFSHRR